MDHVDHHFRLLYDFRKPLPTTHAAIRKRLSREKKKGREGEGPER